MKVIVERDDGTQFEVAVGSEVVVGDVRVTVQKYSEPTFYDPVNVAPGASGGGAGE